MPTKSNPRTSTIERELEEILTYLELGEVIEDVSAEHYGEIVPLSYFKQAEPMLGRFLDTSPNKERLFSTQVHPSEMTHGFDISLISKKNDETNFGLPTKGYGLTRIKSVGLNQVRGRKIKSPFVVRYSHGMVEDSGMAWTQSFYMNWTKKGWSMMDDRKDYCKRSFSKETEGYLGHYEVESKPVDQEDFNIQIAMAIELDRYQQWRAVISATPNGPSISLTTDPSGARTMFKDRDVPEGKDRRAALKAWISDHWRTLPQVDDDENDMTYVREHMRGATDLRWHGYYVTIIPAEKDMDKNIELALKRHEMRRTTPRLDRAKREEIAELI